MSAERQREFIRECSHDDAKWFEFEEMALTAAAALKRELQSNPAITNVQLGAGEIIDERPPGPREIVLNVCTVLPDSQCLDQIPDRFAGFVVKQLNLGDKRAAYIKTWRRLFMELKGWDEVRIQKWIERWDDELSGRHLSVIYHYGPVRTFIPELVDEITRRKVGSRLSLLYGEIENVIERGGAGESNWTQHPDTLNAYDWENVRNQVSLLIEGFRSK